MFLRLIDDTAEEKDVITLSTIVKLKGVTTRLV